MAHSACEVRFFFSAQLLKVAVSHFNFFADVLHLPAIGKDYLEKCTLAISFNSLCYDMFDSS